MNRQEVRHILQFVEGALADRDRLTGCPNRGQMHEARKRMDALDVAAHLPERVRSAFLKLRIDLNKADSTTAPHADLCQAILDRLKRDVLEPTLAEPEARNISRFAFVADPALRGILASDLAEAEASLEAGLPKACVTLCGSVLEAAIYDKLRTNPQWVMSRTAAIPGKRGGGKRDIAGDLEEDQWKLAELLTFCAAHDILDTNRAAGLSTYVREPRNFIHPIAVIRKGEHPSISMAKAALGLVEMALEDISRAANPPRP